MGKITIFLSIFLLLLGFIPQINQVFAASSCASVGINYSPKRFQEDSDRVTLILTGVSDGRYQMRFSAGEREVYEQDKNLREIDAFGGTLTQTITRSDDKLIYDTHVATLQKWTGKEWKDWCGDITYMVGYKTSECRLNFRNNPPQDNEQFAIDVLAAPKGTYKIEMVTGSVGPFGNTYQSIGNVTVDSTGMTVGEKAPKAGPFPPQTTQVNLWGSNIVIGDHRFCSTALTIKPAESNQPREIPSFSPLPSGASAATPCTGPNCSKAGGESCDNNGFKTAIGCIRTEPVALVKDVMTFIIGISGGFAFLMMLLGAFQMLTSAGNPETLAAGKDRFTSAVIGLLFVIFAVLLLQIIGFDILKLPGFKR